MGQPLLSFDNFSDIILSNLCLNFATQMIYCVVYGFTAGTYRGLNSVVALDIMGMEKFILGYGVQLLSMGTAMIVGPTIAGKVTPLVSLGSKIFISMMRLFNRRHIYCHRRI